MGSGPASLRAGDPGEIHRTASERADGGRTDSPHGCVSGSDPDRVQADGSGTVSPGGTGRRFTGTDAKLYTRESFAAGHGVQRALTEDRA